MLLRCELMLLKWKINTNTKKRIFASYKMFRKGMEILILSFNYSKLSISYFFVLILDFNSISSHFNCISSHFNSISSQFNSINSSQQHWEAAPTTLHTINICTYVSSVSIGKIILQKSLSFSEGFVKSSNPQNSKKIVGRTFLIFFPCYSI